jgi:hypothetical protein
MPGRVAQAPVNHGDHVVQFYGSHRFPADLDSAREARCFVLGLLGSRLEPPVVADASIVIAELAANAVLHARSPFRVTVSESGGFVRINVADAVPLPDGGLVTVPGHGLDVVSKVAARWAAEPRPDGKVVWAELPAGPRDQEIRRNT